MKKRAMDEEKIEFAWNTELLEIHGSQEDGVTGARLVHHPEGHPTERLDDPETEEYTLDCGGVFYAIGHDPNTGFLEGSDVDLDAEGYVETLDGRTSRTAVEGVFAAGDVADDRYQQAVTAAGMGCMAAIDAEEWLEEVEAEEREEAAAPE